MKNKNPKFLMILTSMAFLLTYFVFISHMSNRSMRWKNVDVIWCHMPLFHWRLLILAIATSTINRLIRYFYSNQASSHTQKTQTLEIEYLKSCCFQLFLFYEWTNTFWIHSLFYRVSMEKKKYSTFTHCVSYKDSIYFGIFAVVSIT